MFSYLYPIPAEKLLSFIGKGVYIYTSKVGLEYTLDKVQGNRVFATAEGVQSSFNSKDVCYLEKPKEFK